MDLYCITVRSIAAALSAEYMYSYIEMAVHKTVDMSIIFFPQLKI